MAQLMKIRNELFVSDRIITYKTAAAIMEVDVNEAKSILDKFVTDMKNKDESLCVTYVVGGITSDNKHKIVLIPDSKYDKAKSLFSTVTVDHIYSIQKSPHLDWSAIANVNDFMRENKVDKPADIPIKVEKDLTTTKSSDSNNKKNSKSANKKGSVLNFFGQSTSSKDQNIPINNKELSKSHAKKEQESKSGKVNMLSSFITKNSNKENNVKVSNTTTPVAVQIEEKITLVQDSDNEDEEFVVKKNKKRSRVLKDDDDDVTPTNKFAKVDILDDNEDEELPHEMSSEDIFGSPEKYGGTSDVEENIPSDVTEMDSQSTVKSEPTDNMYEDDDGYFVTEKTPVSKKNSQIPNQLGKSKKEIEKKEKAVKKEINKKIRTNTNQKTLLNFFTKN